LPKTASFIEAGFQPESQNGASQETVSAICFTTGLADAWSRLVAKPGFWETDVGQISLNIQIL
jgi:hypothetical protein